MTPYVPHARAVVEKEMRQKMGGAPNGVRLRDLLTLTGFEAGYIVSADAGGETAAVSMDDIGKLTAKGREDYKVLLDAIVETLRATERGYEIAVIGVAPELIEELSDAAYAHAQAEQQMGDMTP